MAHWDFHPPPVHGEISLDAAGKVCDVMDGFYGNNHA
jgi:hypothetical protein